MSSQTMYMIKVKGVERKHWKACGYFAVLFTFLFLSVSVKGQHLPERPNPPRLVNDFAGMMSAAEQTQLEQKLVAFDQSTTNQIAVVTVDSLQGDDISDFAIKLYHKWGIGEAKKSNGVLVLVSKPDRKVFIATGRGLEPVITDALSKRFIELDIIPKFKQGQFYAGLDSATTHLMQLAAGEYHEARVPKDKPSRGGNLFIIIALVIFLVILFSRGSGGGPQAIGRGGAGFPFWFLLGALTGSSGGNRSWGSSGGGDSGGGGFGGFGGGDSGGGGAGGSW